jgi:hypothetical protein
MRIGLASHQAPGAVPRSRVHRPNGPGIGPSSPGAIDEESILGLAAAGSQMTSKAEGLLGLRDVLRRRPRCGSDDSSDRKVTKARPASPGAASSELA